MMKRYYLDTPYGKFFIAQKCVEDLKSHDPSKDKYVSIFGYYEGSCNFEELVEPFGLIKTEKYEKGTAILSRRFGVPYAAIKRALRTLKKWNVSVEECFDGNWYGVNSSIDESLNGEVNPYKREVINAINTLQWAGFVLGEVCAYDPPYEAYLLEKKIR